VDYAEDDAGGLMNPRFARLRPEMSIDEAISYLRKQTREKVETVYYAYVLDAQQRLLGVVSLRQLFQAAPARRVEEVMRRDVVTVREDTDQESVGRLFCEQGCGSARAGCWCSSWGRCSPPLPWATSSTRSRAVVLSLFIPLIISSGGNSGSQATTLVDVSGLVIYFTTASVILSGTLL
jgi:Mg/Co/Ni transporter MgtE